MTYSNDIKTIALARMKAGESTKSVANDLWMSPTTLRVWRRKERMGEIDSGLAWSPQFPLSTKREKTLDRQIEHIMSEVREVKKAVDVTRDGHEPYESSEDEKIDVIMELLDVIHCAETAIIMACDEMKMPRNDISVAKARVISKNVDRGYYKRR